MGEDFDTFPLLKYHKINEASKRGPVGEDNPLLKHTNEAIEWLEKLIYQSDKYLKKARKIQKEKSDEEWGLNEGLITTVNGMVHDLFVFSSKLEKLHSDMDSFFN
tara:strand:- start:1562 stop:1876 length:315 start_codon:yes stop_codon:yes gene_type:complete